MQFSKIKRAIAAILTAIIMLASIAELTLGNIGYESNEHIFKSAYEGIDRIAKKDFADLRVVTENGHGCQINTSEIYKEDCYWLSTPTNIPTALIHVARLLRIGERETASIGILLGLALISTEVYVLVSTCGWAGGCLGALLILWSHSFRYTIERGNIDILVYFCSVITCSLCAVYLSSERKKNIQDLILTGAISTCVAVGTLIKVYPIFILPLVAYTFTQKNIILKSSSDFTSDQRLKGFSWRQIAAISFAIFSSLIVLSDIPHMLSSSSYSASGGMSYGLKTLPANDVRNETQYIMKLLFIACGALMWRNEHDIQKSTYKHLRSYDSQNSSLVFGSFVGNLTKSTRFWELLSGLMFLAGSLLFVGSYLLFNNGNYRLFVFISLAAPAVIKFSLYSFSSKAALEGWGLNSKLYSLVRNQLPLVLIFTVSVFNYRPYIDGLQYYTNLFWSFIILPCLCGYLLSQVISLFMGLFRFCRVIEKRHVVSLGQRNITD